MAKRVDPLKAKAAKQRKIAIVLGVLFVLVIAFQGPKTLKMLKGPPTAAVAEDGSDPTALPAGVEAPTGTPAPTTGTPVATPSSPTSPTATPGSAGAPSDGDSQAPVLVNSDVPVAAGEGQLLSFDQFESKDPFQQQVDKDAGAPATGAVDGSDTPNPDDDSSAGSDPVSPGTDPSIPGSAENPPLSTGGMGSSGSSGSSGSGSSGSGGTSTPTTPGSGPAAATTISVNGVEQTVNTGTPFPTDQPTFELVSLGTDGKSVKIGVAGGSLKGGGATVTLKLGKPLTLQNTADGSRFKLVLLSVEGAATAAPKG